ncbi:MAG: glutaminase A [Candidatus Sericytochromatia bacterium]
MEKDFNNFIIPKFKNFCDDIVEIFLDVKKNTEGKVADYIPQLARVNPEQFSLSICTIDGQRFSYGDSETSFCFQSICKPINYCIVHENLGEEKVHTHVGREPSGLFFNEISFNKKGLPHNPLINSGAIMTCSLIKQEMDISDRFDYVNKVWTELTGGIKPNFNNAVYLSEKQTADRNFALAYLMRENKAFPKDTNILETLDFYFQCCSMELTTKELSVVAASLANAGICPITNKKVFNTKTIQNCLSLMYSCGMYDFSGEFAFKIGLPAKSGVSGALLVVVPQVMGICIWSPRLDRHGNSIRGVEFCKKLVDNYNFHHFDMLVADSTKKDPRKI